VFHLLDLEVLLRFNPGTGNDFAFVDRLLDVVQDRLPDDLAEVVGDQIFIFDNGAVALAVADDEPGGFGLLLLVFRHPLVDFLFQPLSLFGKFVELLLQGAGNAAQFFAQFQGFCDILRAVRAGR